MLENDLIYEIQSKIAKSKALIEKIEAAIQQITNENPKIKAETKSINVKKDC